MDKLIFKEGAKMSRVLPILFNTDMVRAILDDRKGTTRRIAKGFIPDDAIWGYTTFTPKGYISCRGTFVDGYGEKFFKLHCEPGDILYVRETWRRQSLPDGKSEIQYRADFSEQELKCYGRRGGCAPEEWRPSIHMPKEVARIFLRVTDVRLGRLQDIAEEQSKAEGIREYTKDGILNKYAITDDWWSEYHRKHQKEFNGTYWQDMPRTAKEAFSYLWNTTLKKSDVDRYGWDANPWVWVIEFERCEKPECN